MATSESTLVPWWIAEQAGGSAVKVFIAIDKLQRQHKDGASIRDLCVASGLSQMTVQKAIKELRGLGAIESEVRNAESGQRLANAFTLAS